MKRRQFIKYFVLFSTILISKPSRLFASINSVRLGKKAPDFLLNGFNKKPGAFLPMLTEFILANNLEGLMNKILENKINDFINSILFI